MVVSREIGTGFLVTVFLSPKAPARPEPAVMAAAARASQRTTDCAAVTGGVNHEAIAAWTSLRSVPVWFHLIRPYDMIPWLPGHDLSVDLLLPQIRLTHSCPETSRFSELCSDRMKDPVSLHLCHPKQQVLFANQFCAYDNGYATDELVSLDNPLSPVCNERIANYTLPAQSQLSDWVAQDHNDVIKWKHFPRHWPFVRGIHRSPVNSPHKGQWRGALMFSLICAWINDWVNNREAGELRRHHTHYDITVMIEIWHIHKEMIQWVNHT